MFNAVFNLFGIIVFLIMVQGFWGEFSEAWRENEIAGVPGVITFIVWPFYLILLVGAVATGIEFLLRSYGKLPARGALAKPIGQGERDQTWLWLVIALAAFAVVIYF